MRRRHFNYATYVAAVIVLASLLFITGIAKLSVHRSAGDGPDAFGAANDMARRIAKNLLPDQGDLESVNQYVFSAYFDTRPTLGGRKYVRVIVVLDTKAYKSELLCQFMYESGRFSFSTIAKKSAIGVGLPHKQHYYKEFVLSCPISNDTSSAAFVFIQTHDAALRSQVLRVRHNPLSLGQSPPYPQKVVNCVSVTFGKPNEYRLIEWLEAQRLLKMDKVQLHFYHLLNKQFEAVAQAYSAEGFVDVRKIGCPFCDAGHEERLGLLLMSPAINQCFYENLGRYTYTAVFDLDEIVVPQQHPDYPTMLSALEKMENTSSFAFPNWYHFSELGEDSTVDSRMYMLRHPYRTKNASPLRFSTKSIHKSCCVVALHNHFSWEDVPQPNTKTRFFHVATNIGVNEHYKRCHIGEKDCKWMAVVADRTDGSRLTRLMRKQLVQAFYSKLKQIFGTV